MNEDKQPLNDFLPICTSVFADWNLLVNTSKTDFTHVYLCPPKPVNRNRVDPNTKYRRQEDWRNHKILGSLLDSTAGIQNSLHKR